MIWFLILIIDISLDAFVLMMEKGATTLKVDIKTAIKHSVIFAIVESILFILGNFIGRNILDITILSINQYIATLAFMIIGMKILIMTNKKKVFEEKLNNDLNIKESIKTAFIAGIDCFLVGAGCSSLNLSYLMQFLVVFFVTFAVICVALYVGYYKGAAYQKLIGYLCAGSYFFLAIIFMLRLV